MDGHEDQDVQDDCDQDAVANMEDICPCDPTKSITDLHGLVPHEVWIGKDDSGERGWPDMHHDEKPDGDLRKFSEEYEDNDWFQVGTSQDVQEPPRY